jgi:hypothetical protein
VLDRHRIGTGGTVVLRTLPSNRTRCIAIALGLMAISVVLQWLSTLVSADPARTKSVLEFLYLGRGAALQALHVMALALLTIGVLQPRLFGSSFICAGWAASACLIETAQHPAVIEQLLQWADTGPLPSRALDATLGFLVNARFAWSEIAASLIGGAAALELVRRQEGGDRP